MTTAACFSRSRLGRAVLVGVFCANLHATASAQTYESALLDGVAARDRALETNDERDWQRAVEHFARARHVRSTKESEFEFAEAARRLGFIAEAYEAYEAAIELGIRGKAEARAREFVSGHADQVAHLDIAGPAGAVIHVDARGRGTLPLPRPLVVPAGKSRLHLRHSNFEPWEQPIDLQPRSRERLTPALRAHVPTVVAVNATAPADTTPLPQPNVVAKDDVGWGTPVLIAGGSLFTVGAVGFLATLLVLPGARRELAARCALSSGGECIAATAENLGQAQAAANQVETLENLRWVAAAGAGLGLVTAGVGLWQTAGSTRAAPRANLSASPRAVSLTLRGTF